MNHTEELERQMLADSVRKWAERACRPADRLAATEHIHGCPPQRWAEFAEMGWLGVALREADGGLGGGLPDLCVVAEELGRALVVEPFVASVALGAMLLADVAGAPLRGEWLPALAQGGKRVVFAAREDGVALATVGTTAARMESGWTLQGDKALAPGASGADGCVVMARTGRTTLGLFLVEAGGPGLQVERRRLYDGRHAASLQLRGAPGHLLLEAADAQVQAQVRCALDRALVAHCAETTGTMRVAFDITREYLVTRKQFGKVIAANQVVQHRLVDLYVEIEELRALWQAAAASPGPRLVAALAARTTATARQVWEETLQLHGAIGMTEEYVLGGYVRRLALASSLYGDTHSHLERLAALSLDGEMQ